MSKRAQIIIQTNRNPRYDDVKKGVTRVLAEYPNYVLVEVTDDQFTKLKTQGFSIKEDSDSAKIRIGNVIFEAQENREDLWPGNFGNYSYNFFVIQFVGPPKPGWLEKLRKIGALIGEYVPNNAYVVRMTAATSSQTSLLRGMDFVRFVTEYLPEFKISSVLKGQKGALSLDKFRELPIDEKSAPYSDRGNLTIRIFMSSDMDEARRIVSQLGAHIIGSENDTMIVAVRELSNFILASVKIPSIKWIEPYAEPTIFLDVSASIIGAPDVWGNNHNLDGSGQIIAVADTGLDTGVNDNTMHADFRGRIVALHGALNPNGRKNDVSDPDIPPRYVGEGHGTHVAGTVLGNGSSSQGTIKGIAPSAQLVFQSQLDPNGGLGGLPVDLNTLFQQAYDDGARVHSNSWGAPLHGQYPSTSSQVDEFVSKHRDMVIIIAAGNDATDGDSDGVVDTNSISTPGTAKNCITVGGCENKKVSQSRVWNQQWSSGGRFPTDPIKSDMWANEPEGMMAFSGRGPTNGDKGRTKPDVVAPGSSILSTKSSLVTVKLFDKNPFWGASTNPAYMYEGGTSMATPHVAGAAALVRQRLLNLSDSDKTLHWRNKVKFDDSGNIVQQGGKVSPTAALVKAVLINGTHVLSGQYSAPKNDSMDPKGGGNIPNNNQGFGRINLNYSLFPDNPRILELFDGHILSQNDQREYQFKVGDNAELNVTLAWTDSWTDASGFLTNNLSLVVNDPDNNEFHGNFRGIQTPGNNLDDKNNVQKVSIFSPVEGIYKINVMASGNIAPAPNLAGQDFALVACGELLSTFKAKKSKPKPPGDFPSNPGPLPAAKLCNSSPPLNPIKGDGPLVRGDSRSDLVKQLQTILSDGLGYDLGTTGDNGDGIDGVFGDQTENAVASFQQDNKDWTGTSLNVDKRVGPETSDALNRSLVGVWYDSYQSPREITQDTLVMTATTNALQKGLTLDTYGDYKVSSAKKVRVIQIGGEPMHGFVLYDPMDKQFSYDDYGDYVVFDANGTALVSGSKKSDAVITVPADKQPATVELKVGQTFRTFYVESTDDNKNGDSADGDKDDSGNEDGTDDDGNENGNQDGDTTESDSGEDNN